VEECAKWLLDAEALSILQGQVAQAILVETKKDKRLLLLCNVHIYYLWLRPDIQVVQAGFMMQQLQAFAERIQERDDRPIHLILCGDFNSVPGSTVYEYLLKGGISEFTFEMLKQHPIFAQVTQQEPQLPPDGKEKSSEEHGRKRGPRTFSQQRGFPFQQLLNHQFELKSAYRQVKHQEPLYTNHGGDFIGTLDYIFYGQLRPKHRGDEQDRKDEETSEKKGEEDTIDKETLEVTRVFDFVDLELVERHLGCPNIQFPSDHMSLKATFTFL